jgi:hypothetical protein
MKHYFILAELSKELHVSAQVSHHQAYGYVCMYDDYGSPEPKRSLLTSSKIK